MQTACFFIRGVASSPYRFKHTFTRAGLVPNSFLPQWDWKVSPPALLVMWHPSARSGLSTRLDIPSSDNLHGKAVVETKIWTRCQDMARCCLLSESIFLPSTAGCRQVWDVNSRSPFFCTIISGFYKGDQMSHQLIPFRLTCSCVPLSCTAVA